MAAGLSSVYVAAQRNLVALGTGGGITYFHSTLDSPVRGLHAPMYPGNTVYVAERRAIVELDGDTGLRLSSFAADTPRLTGLGYQVRPPTGDSVKCAC